MREGAVELLRRAGKRLSGPLARKQSGHFYVWTRVRVGFLERVARRGRASVVLDAITLEALPSRAAGARYRELEPATDDISPPPGWVWPSGFPSALRTQRVVRRGQGVVELPGGVVFGGRGYFGPDPKGVLSDASSLWAGDDATVLIETADALAVGLEDLEGVTASIWAGNADSNYAHCLLQSIPRLDLIRRGFGLESDRYLLGEQAPMMEALSILEIPTDRLLVVPFEGAPAYQCEMLRAATSPHEFGVEWVAGFLRELFLPDPPTGSSRRLYVLRGVPKAEWSTKRRCSTCSRRRVSRRWRWMAAQSGSRLPCSLAPTSSSPRTALPSQTSCFLDLGALSLNSWGKTLPRSRLPSSRGDADSTIN
jgi:hypothetical protein